MERKNMMGERFGTEGQLADYWGKNRFILKKRFPALYRQLLAVRGIVPDTYRLSWAKTGDLVLDVAVGQNTVRVNSNYNPWKEASLFVKNASLYEGKGILVGFGMGYHIEAFLQCEGLERLVVLEYDLYQLAIALSYRNLVEVLSDSRLTVIHCGKWKDYQAWLSGQNADQTVSVWYPSVQSINNTALREQLENYWVELSSARKFSPVLEKNFAENIARNDEEVSVLEDQFRGKNMVLAAGGPSLDENLDVLKGFDRSDHFLVCVGKVAKKLVKAGILPDYIVVIDAKAGTKWQIAGIEDCGVPLLYLCTAAANLVESYQGKRYIAFQRGFQPAEDYADEAGYPLYQTGGSIATFAIDLGISLKCRRIICVGLDLGYPNMRTHASGIGRGIATDKMLRKVEGIMEDTVYTSKTLDLYRRWIEKRIAKEYGTEFINASKGARIHGMEEQNLGEYFQKRKPVGKPQMTKIFCFVEKQDENFEAFLEEHDHSYEIHVYSPIIEICDGNSLTCIEELLALFWADKEKAWFVTDVEELYHWGSEIAPSLFERVVCLKGKERWEEFFLQLDAGTLSKVSEKSIPDTLFQEVASAYLGMVHDEEWIHYVELSKRIEYIVDRDDWHRRAFLSYLCRGMLCFGREGKIDLSEEYWLFTQSMLVGLDLRPEDSNVYLHYILESVYCGPDQYYFVWNQFKSSNMRKRAGIGQETREILDTLYEKSYNGYLALADVEGKLGHMPAKMRDRNTILVLTIQYLGGNHAPSKTVEERCKILKQMGRQVYLVNTTEQYTAQGYIPFYHVKIGNVNKGYYGKKSLALGDEEIPFYQLSEDLPILSRLKILQNIIQEIRPYYILSIGSGSILADLCGNIVPCASMALVFSALPKSLNSIRILGRKMTQQERELPKMRDVVESCFTFELKPQKKHFTRQQYGIPEDRFVLAVVGIRLQYDVTRTFCSVLENMCKKGCYVIFVGIYDTYASLEESYPILWKHSSFVGYCDDILALMELCDLYVNPDRMGGGFSVIEAFEKGVPGVYLPKGDVYAAGGEEFAVADWKEMEARISQYKEDGEYYRRMSEATKERAHIMTSSMDAIRDLDAKIMWQIEEKYW